MALWTVTHFNNLGQPLDDFIPSNISFSTRNSEVGELSYELPLSEPFMGRDAFAPYRTNVNLYRDGNLIWGGIHTNRNLSNNRDTVLVAAKDWLHYLEKRLYPFDPYAYVNTRDWASWPKQWPVPAEPGQPANPLDDLRKIVEDILRAMATAPAIGGDPDTDGTFPATPPFIYTNVNTGSLASYTIYPGDQTTVFDHIKTLSEKEAGFEFDILPISLEFKMYAPNRATSSGDVPVYRLTAADGVIEIDWDDAGPLATVTVGYGSGSQIKKGKISTYGPSVQKFRRLDKSKDFGNQITSQLELDKLAALEGYRDRHQQKKLRLVLLNPEFLADAGHANFYTGGRPRSIIGKRIMFEHEFGFHKVDASFRVMAMNWEIDQSSNETVELELETMAGFGDEYDLPPRTTGV